MKKYIINIKIMLSLIVVSLFLSACANTVLIPEVMANEALSDVVNDGINDELNNVGSGAGSNAVSGVANGQFIEPALLSNETIMEDSLVQVQNLQRTMGNIETEVEEPKLQTRNVDVCSTSGTKSYMGVNMINQISLQYDIITEKTVRESDGLLYTEDGFMGVALGSYFGELGKKFIFTLDTGVQLKVIKVEAKADDDTINGCQHKTDDSVIEFVVDDALAAEYWGIGENGYILSGNFNNADQFRGEIVSIEEIIE